MLTRRFILLGLAAALLPASVWSKDIGTAPAELGDGWPVAAPSEARLDRGALTSLVEMIETSPTVPNVHAVLIEHRGRLVFERY